MLKNIECLIFFFNSLQHHCRNCGAVVCGPCSSKKFLLPQQSTKPVRVCLDCYDSLSQSKNEQVNLVEPSFAAAWLSYHFGVLCIFPQTKSSTGNKSNNNADSSGEDDSDDEEEPPKETHDEVSCDRNFMVNTFNIFSFDLYTKFISWIMGMALAPHEIGSFNHNSASKF